MGLDIALGVMIFLGAIRGWFRGFVIQAIRLGGLVGSVFAAGPVRDYSRPYVAPYLRSIDPTLLDRILWWSSATVSYVAMVGLASLAVKLYRRRPYGEPEPNRADQLAGFLLATGKGAVVAAFLVGALDRYVLSYARQVPWAAEQVQSSQALVWNEQYKPAERIWSTPPVQMLVAHVRKMGIERPTSDGPTPATPTEPRPVQTAATRPPRLDLPVDRGLDANSPDFVERFDEALGRLERPGPRP